MPRPEVDGGRVPPDQHRGRPDPVVVAPLAGVEDAAAFRRLNEQWITELFDLVDADRAVLTDPRGTIIDRGGQVLMARTGPEVLGCVAIVPTGLPAAGPPVAGGTWELSKMAVVPHARRRGIGRALMTCAIDHARAAGARELLLGSNTTRLAPAVQLYESLGFQRVPAGDAPASPYARADVFLRLLLQP